MVIGAHREFDTCFNIQTVSNRGVIEKPKKNKQAAYKTSKVDWALVFGSDQSFRITLATSTALHGLPGWQTFGTGPGHKVLLQSSNSVLKCIDYIQDEKIQYLTVLWDFMFWM